MSYCYNTKSFRRAGDLLLRSVRSAQRRRGTAILTAILILVSAILLGSSIGALASAGDQPELHKYYTSIQVQRGDTLWDIADRYTADGRMDRKAFIDEVTALNGLKDGQIRSGDYIVVTYYSEEVQ